MARGSQPLPDRAPSKRVKALAGLRPFLAPYRGLVLGALAALTLTFPLTLDTSSS